MSKIFTPKARELNFSTVFLTRLTLCGPNFWEISLILYASQNPFFLNQKKILNFREESFDFESRDVRIRNDEYFYWPLREQNFFSQNFLRIRIFSRINWLDKKIFSQMKHHIAKRSRASLYYEWNIEGWYIVQLLFTHTVGMAVVRSNA